MPSRVPEFTGLCLGLRTKLLSLLFGGTPDFLGFGGRSGLEIISRSLDVVFSRACRLSRLVGRRRAGRLSRRSCRPFCVASGFRGRARAWISGLLWIRLFAHNVPFLLIASGRIGGTLSFAF
jgi:hypothetical protein